MTDKTPEPQPEKGPHGVPSASSLGVGGLIQVMALLASVPGIDTEPEQVQPGPTFVQAAPRADEDQFE